MRTLILVAAAATMLFFACTPAVASAKATPTPKATAHAHQQTHKSKKHNAAKKPKAQPTSKAPTTILPALQGNGQGNTAPFNAPSHWKLTYTYNCSAFGQAGNFAVMFVPAGPNALPDPIVNELSTGATKTVDEYSSGKGAHLEIDSECSWTVSATSA